MSQITKIEFRAVIRFFTQDSLHRFHTIQHLLDGVYSDNSPSYSVIKDWSRQLGIGQESLERDARTRTERAVEGVTDDKLELAEEVVLKN